MFNCIDITPLAYVLAVLKSGIGWVLAGAVGWWLASYFQAAKIYFDSKRIACERLVALLAEMLALATRWAEARARGSDDDESRQKFNRDVEQTWVLIGQIALYAKASITTPFIEINLKLVDLMSQFDSDPKARAVLLGHGEDWVRFREEEIFQRLDKIRKRLLFSILWPWLDC